MQTTPVSRRFGRFVFTQSALALTASALLAQIAPAPPQAVAPAKTNIPVVTTSAAASGEILELSPFEVNAAQDRGYLATSTMSGTRLNSKLEDLSASISVVTKQQLLDTASIDINDVFKYEVNTEGTNQFTNFSVDRGVVTDGVQSDPQGSTRMRGLTAANTALNGVTTSLPFDTYNVDAVEISRGPNSTVFGLGNTGGGVNVIQSKANTTRAITSFGFRGDSYDGYRMNFDVNRPLIKDKLALRALSVYEEKGYVRKPSKDTTRRVQVALTYRPFKKTTLAASFESYRNFNNRPNTLTPRDTITDWVNSGKPTWDPLTQTVHFGNGAPAIVNVAQANEATLLPYGLATSDTAFQNLPSAYLESNGKLGLFMISRTPAATGLGPTNVAGTLRLLQNGNYYVRNSTTNPLFNPVEINNRSLYDWTSVNLSAPNFATTKGETSQVALDQTFYRSPKQNLALQASWVREKISTFDRRFLGSGGANLAPFIDVNEKLLDGTANPYFLRPYIGGSAPSFRKGRNDTENYRATLAYQVDLSREQNWLHWLGRHNLTGYAEYRTNLGGNLGYQDTISSTNTWMGGTPASRNSTSYRLYPRFYVGDATGQNIDYAPARSSAPPYTYSLRYLNGVTNQWVNENVTFDEYYDANRLNKRLLSTTGGAWQGFFWGDRIIPILGLRKDYNRTRDGNTAISPTVATNGYFDLSPMNTYGQNDWVKNRGKTTNEGVVVKALSWLHLSYSQSNSFSPGSQTYDVWGSPLPDPHGKTKDYGFQFNLFEGRLVIVAKQYETLDIGRSTSDLNTIVQRAVRMDRRSSSGDPGLTDFLTAQLLVVHPTWTDQQLSDETKRLALADGDFIRSHINKVHGDASNSYSSGKEVEVTFNPTRFWTMKATGSQSNPLNGILSPAVQNYIDSRMPTWTTVKDPVSGADWWTLRAANGTIARDFYINNVLAPLKLAVALQGKRRTQTREYHLAFLSSYQLAGLTENRWLKPLTVGGSVRWEDQASIGFAAAKPDADGIVREFDPNKPYWDRARYYLDASASYKLRLFHDKVQCRVQLNANSLFENGRLQRLSVNPDGGTWAYRIIDPTRYILSANFDL